MKLFDFTHLDKGIEMSPEITEYIQSGQIERTEAVLKALVGSQTGLIILEGCIWSGVAPDYNLSAGRIYYPTTGKIYTVDAVNLNDGVSTPQFFLSSPYSGEKAIFGDGVLRDVKQLDKIVAQIGGVGAIANWTETRRIEWVLRNRVNSIGEVKMLAVDPADFDGTGLGTEYKEWEKWALMNGSNATIDMGGFFPVGMKTSDLEYDSPGDTGGLKEVTLTSAQSGVPAHTHPFTDSGAGADTGIATGGAASFTNLPKNTSANVAQDASLAHENRPPFKVLRFIQKIS